MTVAVDRCGRNKGSGADTWPPRGGDLTWSPLLSTVLMDTYVFFSG